MQANPSSRTKAVSNRIPRTLFPIDRVREDNILPYKFGDWLPVVVKREKIVSVLFLSK